MSLKISIVTAVYNNCSTIAQAIESVLSQDYPHIEYIIIDGCSTDGTVDIIHTYNRRISKWISEPDEGLYDAMNKGINIATGDIIGILNSDDFYENHQVLSKIASLFEEYSPDAIYGDLVYVNNTDTNKVVRYWKSKSYREDIFLLGWMPPHPTFFVKRSIYQSYGNFTTLLRSSADYELMLRFIHKHKIKLLYLPEVLVRMRVGGISNQSWKNRLRANQEDYQAWKLNGLKPPFYTLLLKPLRKLIQYIKKPGLY